MASLLPSEAQILQAMKAHFPESEYAVNTTYDLRSNTQILQVLHRAAARVVSSSIDPAAYDDICQNLDLFRSYMSSIEVTVYQDLAAHGYGSSPFEPGNSHHEEIKALCYLAGYGLLEHMPATAETRGDAWIYLVPTAGGVADKMPPKCLALPLDFWRQLLIRKLDKHVANKPDVV